MVVGMGSLGALVGREVERWGRGVGMISRELVKEEMVRLGVGNGIERGGEVEDEESEMSRMLDVKVGAV